MKEKIDFKEFLEIEKKLEIRIGLITSVEDVPKSDKLIKLIVHFGEGDDRVVVTNIKPHLANPQYLVNLRFAFVTNLAPTKIMGIESHAMILPGDVEKGASGLIATFSDPGTKLL